LPADSAIIRFDGRDIGHLPAHRRVGFGIGRSFQNLGLMPHETVATNVLATLHRSAPYTAADVLLRPWRRSRGERYLEHRCADALARFGLLADWDQQVADLDFGKARFVEIAALVAESPRLMLLDEPTTGLDVEEIARLGHELRELQSAGTTMLVVAHDVGFVMRVCEYVYVLAEGRVLSHGPPAAVQSDPAVIEAYLGRPA
jgi:branched-chain amino acid transport system ATP-binding protein